MLLHLLDAIPLVLAKQLVEHGSVEPFDVGVLLWLARVNVLQLNTLVLGPCLYALTDILQVSDHTLTG
jgi:hypothetical protein